MYDFRFNYPLSQNHHALLIQHLEEVLADKISLGTAAVGGSDNDREIASKWLSRPDSLIDGSNVFVACGGHNAMTSIFLCTGLAGQTVVADTLTYNGLKALAGMLNVTLVPCPFDSDGMLPDALSTICSKTSAKAVYLMPTIHNPLCTVMPENRRREIVEVARKFDLTLIDDDAYGFLESRPPLTFAHLAPERSFYIYSFAKPLSAGLKTSYIVAPDKWKSQIVEAIRMTSSGASSILANLVSQLITSGTAERVIREKRVEGALRQKIVAEMLSGISYRKHPNSFHIWMPLPADSSVPKVESRLRASGVEVVTSYSYQIEATAENNGIRVALGNVESHAEVRSGLEVVAGVFRDFI